MVVWIFVLTLFTVTYVLIKKLQMLIKLTLLLLFSYSLCINFSYAQENDGLKSPSYPSAFINPHPTIKHDLVVPKRRPNFNAILRRITPIVGYKNGFDLVHNGDSANVHSIELGVGLIKGNINEWTSWGPLPLGWDWNYFTLPYITAEYRWLKKYHHYSGIPSSTIKMNPFMLNAGVSGGAGGLLIFLPVPISINGMAGLSTDFRQLYFRGRIGWDIMGFSLGAGIYHSLTKRADDFNNPHYAFFELSYTFLRDN